MNQIATQNLNRSIKPFFNAPQKFATTTAFLVATACLWMASQPA